MKQILLFLLILMITISCTTNDSVSQNEETPFCKLIASPNDYFSKTIRIKAIVLGYHRFIAYQQECNSSDSIIEVDLDFNQRGQIIETLRDKPTQYSSSTLKGNLYSEIEMVGVLSRNDIQPKDEKEITLKYRFSVVKILSISVLDKEILPSQQLDQFEGS